MRIDGEWLLSEDGVVRPRIPAVVRAAGDTWIETTLLLDAGADRTVFNARLFNRLQHLRTTEMATTRLVGVGGAAGCINVATAIRFTRDDGQGVTVRGSFAVFTDIESADVSILGRDVTDNFSVIYDYPNRVVALLASPHSYEIKSR